MFELLDTPTVLEEFLDAYDDAYDAFPAARELRRRCNGPIVFLLSDRAVLVTPLGVRVYHTTTVAG